MNNIFFILIGDFYIERFLDWLTKIDMFFQYTRLLDINVKFIAYKLKGGASV